MQISQRSPAWSVADSATVVWRLVGQQARVECRIRRGADGIELDVARASRRLSRERFPNVHAALARAWEVRRRLLVLGWIDPELCGCILCRRVSSGKITPPRDLGSIVVRFGHLSRCTYGSKQNSKVRRS